MIRLAALTSSRNDPSSRFRIRQFIPRLRELGVDAVEFCPWVSKYASVMLQLTGLTFASRVHALLAARKYDVTWLNRELITGRDTLERFAGRRFLFDVDDAIWLSGRPGFAQRIAARAAGVIAGNRAIADYFRPHARRLWIVPTSVDTEIWRPPALAPNGPWTIGWSGTWWNLKYLYGIEEALFAFLNGHKDARLLVICDRTPVFQLLRPSQWEFMRWSADNEVTGLQRMHVGLMPLADTEWTRAKCGLKLLCYLSAGLPAVVSPVGVAAEMLRHGPAPTALAAATRQEWCEHLEALYRDRSLAKALGQAGRKMVQERYSLERSVHCLARIFEEVAGS